MLWKKEKPNFPEVEFDGERYYVVSIKDLANLDGYKVKFKGVVEDKPEVIYYAAGWPWSISSRIIEEDHGHMTVFRISGYEVRFKGVALVRKGEKVVIYGKIKDGCVEARVIEGQYAIFKS